MAKAWPVGREGMVGISLFLDGPTHDNRADVQVGGFAFRLPAFALLAEFRRASAFQHLLLRYVFALMTQASQLGVCSHHHPIEQRLCRFLSRLFDRVSGDEVAITHELMGALLGVRRVSITQAALKLQAAGIIEYSRGHVKLISRKKLETRSCACGALIRRAFEVVFE
jgi:CRP-like cAMP-binding protein